MNDSKKLAEAIDKRPKEFVIHLISSNKIGFLLNHCNDMIKWLDRMYYFFKYNQAHHEWDRENQKLSDINPKDDQELWLKQLKTAERKEKKVVFWENKYTKLKETMS